MVTHAKDLDFARFAMQSADKFATGFNEFVLVVPDTDLAAFAPFAFQSGFVVRGFPEAPGKGMLHHEAIICEADRWCPDADAVLHQDADCLFTEPVTPADYFVGDKPILLRERYEDFKQYGHRYGWKKCVREATGIDPEWETMCRHPAVHLARTYRKTRELIEAHTGLGFLEYILSCRNEFPQTFAEFPTLGAVALEHFPDAYHWVDDRSTGTEAYKYKAGFDKMFSFWSHGGLDTANDRHPGRTPRQMITEILA